MCQTLVSTGTKAVFLNPTDALHGDIGIVGRDDVVVIVSKSGATDELLRLVPYARVRGAHEIGVSGLALQCLQHSGMPLHATPV